MIRTKSAHGVTMGIECGKCEQAVSGTHDRNCKRVAVKLTLERVLTSALIQRSLHSTDVALSKRKRYRQEKGSNRVKIILIVRVYNQLLFLDLFDGFIDIWHQFLESFPLIQGQANAYNILYEYLISSSLDLIHYLCHI